MPLRGASFLGSVFTLAFGVWPHAAALAVRVASSEATAPAAGQTANAKLQTEATPFPYTGPEKFTGALGPPSPTAFFPTTYTCHSAPAMPVKTY